MKNYIRLLKYARRYWFYLLLSSIFMSLVSALTALTAYLVKPVLDDIFVKKDIYMLKLLPLAVLAIYLLKSIFDFFQSYLMSYAGQGVVRDIRDDLYSHIQELPVSFFKRTPSGVILSRITNDVNLLQGAITDAITGGIKDLFTIIGLIFVIFYTDWKLAMLAMLVFPAILYLISRFSIKLRKFSTKGQISMSRLTSIIIEGVSASSIVKAFNMEEFEKKRFSEENNRYFRLIMKGVKVRALSSPLMEFLGGLGACFIIWFGGYRVIKGYSTPGEFFSFMAALYMLYRPIKDLNKVNNKIQEGITATNRVFEMMDTPREIEEKEDAIDLNEEIREIEFRNVSFKYEDRWILKGINLKVKKGEIVAIVGETGAGKTTLVNLIPRFYDVTEGEILINGRDIRDYRIKSLREKIAIVTQHTILFHDTVLNNIAYGSKKKTIEDIIEVSRIANADEFISRLPDGYNTVIGEAGMKLSGGERQRISIARALLKDAPILILDEATSQLDLKVELEVQKAIERLIKGRTVFMIAHRLSSIKNADRIVVLDGGRIVEEGKHEDLMAKRQLYWKLYSIQLERSSAAVHKN